MLGPTGSGKSDLALSIAACFRGEVVNCDSQQIYQWLDLGTAKVPVAARKGIPHHLIGFLEPDAVFSAGAYAVAARRVLDGIRGRRGLPVVTGGTGFYVRALLDGLFEGPKRDDELRSELAMREARRAGFTHRLLRCLDPASAERIHRNDVQKSVRAVEVSHAARRPMSAMFGQSEKPLEGFAPLKIALSPPRDELYARVNLRCMRMFEQGLVEEVRSILARGYGPDAKAFESIGYQQSLAVIEGRMSVAEAVASTQQATRNYAKRQWTWLRRDQNILWLNGFGDDTKIQDAARCSVSEHHASQGWTA